MLRFSYVPLAFLLWQKPSSSIQSSQVMAITSLYHWAWILVRCPFWSSFSLSDYSCCLLKNYIALTLMSPDSIVHIPLLLLFTDIWVTLPCLPSPPYPTPYPFFKYFNSWLLFSPISILHFGILMYDPSNLGALFLDQFPKDLILHLIPVTHFLTTLWTLSTAIT